MRSLRKPRLLVYNSRIAVDLVRHFWIERLFLGTSSLILLPFLPILSKQLERDGLVGVRHEGLQFRVADEGEVI